jgi:hypothetical protein
MPGTSLNLMQCIERHGEIQRLGFELEASLHRRGQHARHFRHRREARSSMRRTCVDLAAGGTGSALPTEASPQWIVGGARESRARPLRKPVDQFIAGARVPGNRRRLSVHIQSALACAMWRVRGQQSVPCIGQCSLLGRRIRHGNRSLLLSWPPGWNDRWTDPNTGYQAGLDGLAHADGRHDLLFPPACAGCRRYMCAEPGTRVRRHAGRGSGFLERPWCEILGTPFSHEMGEGIVSADAIAIHHHIARARAAVAYGDMWPGGWCKA